MKKIVHLSIKGKVQGVGYRAFVELQAELLGLEGWVRNRRDGSVEAVAAGEAGVIEQLLKECSKGPPASRVAAIDVTDAVEEMLELRAAGEKFGMLPTI
ncbi:MAG: acylphosphatase [Xanthobacteraceae bacterium]|nr:acylphosphatase [Xanthobacteraceae bacterium]MBX3533360.1 acylphosphatase [Xanthobacteraceae bacterium]MCW5679648.1 acylphosphatase [Xanthobacteraceae bacterium]